MKRKHWILAGFIIVKFVLQYILINPAYDLQRDEYLHLDQGNHLAWGYISVPPVTSWISYIIKLLGNGVFWVKFFPALFGAFTMIIVWKMVEALKGNLFALVLASTAILLSVLLRINILFQPNSLDIFFWTFLYFTLIKYINSEKQSWLYLAAVAVGFGVLSKYNIIFLLLGLLPAILFTEHRKILLKREFYIAVLIASLIILPNLIWQYKNRFPTLQQLQELADTQLVNVRRIDFVKEQFLFFYSSAIVIVAAFISLLFYRPFKKYRLFFWSYCFTLSLFIYLKAKPYYAIGLYPVLLAFGSTYLERILSNGWKKYFRPVLVLSVVALSIPFLLIAFPTKSAEKISENNKRYKELGMLRWEDGKDHELPQDFADMLGWSDLARKVDSVYNNLEDKKHTLVFCDNYGQAGAINYYSKFENINAVSLNADYINWINLDEKIRNVILVQEPSDDDPGRTRERPLFDTVSLVGENDNRFSRESGTKIYLLKGAKVDINKIIANEILQRRLDK